MAELVRIRWRETNLERVLNSEGGLVGRHLRVKGQKIVSLAKSQAGKRTGALRASIHVSKRGRYVAGQYIQVGSYVPHAAAHHEGTRPRVIIPQKRRVLRFFVKGVLVFRPVVLHPGTRPNRYLVDSMRKVIN